MEILIIYGMAAFLILGLTAESIHPQTEDKFTNRIITACWIGMALIGALIIAFGMRSLWRSTKWLDIAFAVCVLGVAWQYPRSQKAKREKEQNTRLALMEVASLKTGADRESAPDR